MTEGEQPQPQQPLPAEPPAAAPQPAAVDPLREANQKKILAGILGILLGWLGIHKFILGQTTGGIILVVGSVLGVVFSCFVIPAFLTTAAWIIGIVEGIIYLTKTDAEFKAIYMDPPVKEWF